MIPSDLAARLRMLSDASLFDNQSSVQGLTRVREIQARLSELLPGQRFEATLQRSLPDGTFQAVVAGRSYTLALNHSAKPGDTLELVVTKTNGQTIFAQAANSSAASGGSANAPALSSTGRLISFLLTGQPTPQPAALAAGKPLLNAPPVGNGAQFAPILRQALTQSGLFYESHQAKWLSGKVDLNSLKMEPQGQQATANAARAGNAPGSAANQMAALLSGQPNASVRESMMQALTRVTGISGQSGGEAEGADEAAAGGSRAASSSNTPAQSSSPTPLRSTPAQINAAAGMPARAAEEAAGQRGGENPQQQQSALLRTPTVPERLMPIVHQQLDALGTQTYVWQGQAWPGQNLEWEIEDPSGGEQGGGENGEEWNTTLRLTMPQLGGIEARLHLTSAGVALRLLADDPDTVTALEEASARLDSALSALDLPLTGFVAERRDAE